MVSIVYSDEVVWYCTYFVSVFAKQNPDVVEYECVNIPSPTAMNAQALRHHMR